MFSFPLADIDECMGTDGACSGHGCINLVGSFRCECAAGYVFNSINRVCEGKDIIWDGNPQYCV